MVDLSITATMFLKLDYLLGKISTFDQFSLLSKYEQEDLLCVMKSYIEVVKTSNIVDKVSPFKKYDHYTKLLSIKFTQFNERNLISLARTIEDFSYTPHKFVNDNICCVIYKQ